MWHDYSLALYNDFTNNVAKSFHDWDGLVNGIRLTSLDLGWDEPAEIEVSLGGAPNRGFMAETAAALGNRDGEIPATARSTGCRRGPSRYKITDPQVNYITFQNTAAVAPFANLKLWAIQKIDGAWRQPEDWTRKKSAVFCRDVDDEKLEELVLITRTAIPRPAMSSPGGSSISTRPTRRTRTRCCPSSARRTRMLSLDRHHLGHADEPARRHIRGVGDGDVRTRQGRRGARWHPGRGVVQAGVGHGHRAAERPRRQRPLHGNDCTRPQDLSARTTPVSCFTSTHRITRNDWSAIGGGLTTIQNAHRTFICGEDVLFDGVAPANALWLQFPQSPRDLIGADGRTLSGSASEVLADGSTTQVARWNLKAERKQ